ncbi:efflux RND transporter permease subunit [Calditrichota bacterium]
MKGPIAYMAENHVAANIVMFVFVIGGLLIGKNIKQEVFPEFEIDMVNVSMVYPGASPEEVEEGIVRPIENALSGIDNVKRMTAMARENVGLVIIEVLEGGNVDEVLSDVKAEVDRITTLPEDAERPVVSKASTRRDVMTLIVHGVASERSLMEHAERVRDDLTAQSDITVVEIVNSRPYEIAIEISEENLRKYNLTLGRVAGIVRQASLDLAGGSIKSEGGEILIRTNEKRYLGVEYDSVAVLTQPNGTRLLLGDIADIRDGFADKDQITQFDGEDAVVLKVYRVGDQTPKGISKSVIQYIEQRNRELPPTIKLAVWDDNSELLVQRLNLLLRNGTLGLVLVLIILSLFLEIRLALWVALGIVVAFIGSLMVLPMFDASINMMSLFAFIIILGVVVDDAIVVGENIYVHYKKGMPLLKAAQVGASEVSVAVIFSGLTTFCAFGPLLFVSGFMGKFMFIIPVIVISVLSISLFESLFVLPAHLASKVNESDAWIFRFIESKRKKFDRFVNWLIDKTYVDTLHWVIKNRYATIAIAIAIQLATIGFIAGGHIKFIFMPEIEADEIIAKLTLEPGTSFEETRQAAEFIQATGKEVLAEMEQDRKGGETDLKHIYTLIGNHASVRGPMGGGDQTATNLAEVHFLMKDAEIRKMHTNDFAQKWRDAVGEIPGTESLTFSYQLMARGSDIDVQMSHNDYNVLLTAIDRLSEELGSYGGVSEVSDSYSEGKQELKLKLKPEAEALGITEMDMAQQVRAAFYGAEALRLQRGKNEVKVLVRYPKEDRQSLAAIEGMRLRTPMGGEVPFSQAAYVDEGRGFSAISRVDRRRVVNVSGKVNKKLTTPDEVLSDLKANVIPQMERDYPGLSFDFEGADRDRRESMGSMGIGFLFALFLIFGQLAVLFRSYLQPIAVMSAIPFGIVGAVVGHLLLGYNLSMISMFGIVALSGVVVNASLMLIVFINRKRDEGVGVREAIMEAGVRRFRPIIMTSLTTFFGLVPMIVETSIQARFLIPMAISLGFGILFSTGITLALVPALYMVIDDLSRFLSGKIKGENGNGEIDSVVERLKSEVQTESAPVENLE